MWLKFIAPWVFLFPAAQPPPVVSPGATESRAPVEAKAPAPAEATAPAEAKARAPAEATAPAEAKARAPAEATAPAEAKAPVPAEAEPVDASRPTPDLARGRRFYLARCATCHGPEGRGDGAISRFLNPRPRDFVTEPFKLRSTQPGQPPTDGDLYRTISRGIRGTGMPGFAGLPGADRWQLVAFVKSLAPKSERPGKPLVLPPQIPWSPGRIVQGKAVYQRLQCTLCHGPDGRADGQIADALIDQAGYPIHPFDMTRGWKLKRGDRASDIVATVLTGLDGTPMASYRTMLSDEEAWALVYYIRSLFLDRRTVAQ